MPYISNLKRRAQLDEDPYDARDPGELDYVLTKIILDYLPADAHFAEYAIINGVLDLVKHEFQRRAIDSYEDQKMTLNGDVGYSGLPQNKVNA